MTLPALVSVSDLEALLGVTIDDSDARARQVLAMASAQVRSVVGLTWVDAHSRLTTVPELARAITVAAAARAWANPTGARSSSAGPFASTWDGGVMLTSDEREALASLITDSVPGLGSIRVVAPAYASGTRRPEPWWDEDE